MKYNILILNVIVFISIVVQIYKIYLNSNKIEAKSSLFIRDAIVLGILIVDILIIRDDNIDIVRPMLHILIAVISLIEGIYVIVKNLKESKVKMSNNSIKEAIELSKDGILVLNKKGKKLIINETMQKLLESLNIHSDYFSTIKNIAIRKIDENYIVTSKKSAWVIHINEKHNEMTCFNIDEEYKLHAILDKQNKEIQKNNEKIVWTLENMQYIENEKEVQKIKSKYHDLLRAKFITIASISNK